MRRYLDAIRGMLDLPGWREQERVDLGGERWAYVDAVVDYHARVLVLLEIGRGEVARMHDVTAALRVRGETRHIAWVCVKKGSPAAWRMRCMDAVAEIRGLFGDPRDAVIHVT